MSAIIDFFKRIFGFKPSAVTTTVTNKPETESAIKYHKKSDLNEISLKMNGGSKPVVSETEKPKRKRYYKKKTTNKKTQIKPVNTEVNTNGTTKKTYRTKKPKQTSTVQPESRTDK